MLLEIIIAVFLTLMGLGTILPMLERSLHYLPSSKTALTTAAPDCSPALPRAPYLLLRCVDKKTSIENVIIVRSESGFSLLELLLSISIGLIIISCLGKTYAIASLQSKAVRFWIREDSIVDRIESETMRLFEAVDSHPFPFPPRIHSGGIILLQNGSPNVVMSGSTKLKPSSQTSALTNVKVAMSLLSDIQNCSATGRERSGQACLRYSNSASSSDYQSFILISLDGVFEGQGRLSGQGKCKTFNITLGESMLFENPANTSLCNERLLVPLDFIQTIYQSQQGDFRLISHRTDLNVENQPLTLALPFLRLALEFDSSHESWRMVFGLRLNEKKLASKEFFSVLGRQPVDNLILNNL